MADIEDEYAFLEAAVDGKLPPPPEAPHGNGVEDKPRDSGKSKSKEREGERERSSKEKRHRSRSRSRDRKRSSRERERERDRPSSRGDREREKEREREPRSSKDRDREQERERDRHRGDRDFKRDRSPGRNRRREATPPEVRLAREKERELKELERATRTVFAFNLNVKADERDIWKFFSPAGEVTDVRIITDRHTARSKGMAYVEFAKQEYLFTALALTGQTLMGQPVMVKAAEAEKNVAWEAAQAAKANQADAAALLQAAGLAVPAPAAAAADAGDGGFTIVPIGPPLELHVTGFPQGLGEAELRQVFEPFGAVNEVTMINDESGVESACKIVFARAQDGQAAMAHWNVTELIGCRMTVTAAPTPGAPAAAPAAPPMVPVGSAAAAAAAAAADSAMGELDDEEGGLKLNSQARASLMSRLAGGTSAVPPAVAPVAMVPPPESAPQLVMAAGAPNVDPAVLFAQGVLGPPSPIPTQCILLKNVWRAEQTAEPGWESEVAEDMQEESSKCGQLLHMHLDTASQGFVYVKFSATEGAQAAHKLLNGRFYQGNQILVEYQFVQPYNSHFGLA